jgi:hypothetical protein
MAHKRRAARKRPSRTKNFTKLIVLAQKLLAGIKALR